MDKFDRAILELLQYDASLSSADLAEQVGLSKTACWRRLQALEEQGVIIQKVALLDPAKVNLPLTAFISVRTTQHNDKWFRQFKKLTDNMLQVTEVYRMSGQQDYLIKSHVKDMEGYDALYKELVKADLFDVSTGFVMETMKHQTQLPLSELLP